MIPEFIYALNLEKITVDKKTVLVKEGEECKHLYFILHGCIKLSFAYRKKELISYFYLEGDCATQANSLLYEQPSLLSIETIEWCELLVMKREKCKALLKTNKHFLHWFYRTALEIESNNAKHLQRVISNGGQIKYHMLVKEHPEWVTRFPQFLLASYLGIGVIGLRRLIALDRREGKNVKPDE